MSPTASATPLAQPFRVLVGVYNSAGELVRRLYDGSAHEAPRKLALGAAVVQAGVSAAAIDLGVELPGGPLAWDGRNANGQPVGGGTYVVKVEVLDPHGTVTAIVQSLAAIPPPEPVRLGIYNSAGELVAELALPGGEATDLRVSEREDGFDFSVRYGDGTTAHAGWDGAGAGGAKVGGGVYQAVLRTSGGGRIVRDLQVVPTDSQPPKVLAAPLPGPLGRLSVRLSYAPPTAWSVAVWNLAGELVAQATAGPSQGELVLDLRNAASGVYLVEARGGRPAAPAWRSVCKAALLR